MLLWTLISCNTRSHPKKAIRPITSETKEIHKMCIMSKDGKSSFPSSKLRKVSESSQSSRELSHREFMVLPQLRVLNPLTIRL